MKIRFTLLIGLFLIGFLTTFTFTPTQIKAAGCEGAGNGIWYDNCTSQIFSSGTPFNGGTISLKQNSSTIFNTHFSAPTVNISISDSRFDLTASNNTTANLNFTVVDPTARITYRGGTSGKVSVDLTAACVSSDCFRSSGNIENLNFQGVSGRGGWFTVGTLATPLVGGAEQPANITIQNLEGNGSINITRGSGLTINKYKYDDSSIGQSINFIEGGINSSLIVNDSIYVNRFSMPNAVLNGENTKLLNIINSGDISIAGNADITDINSANSIQFSGDTQIENINYASSIVFNEGTTSNITRINDLDSMIVHGSTSYINNLGSLNNLVLDNSNVDIDNLIALGAVSINTDSTLKLLGGSTPGGDHGDITSIQGSGTLQIEGGETHIHNINLNNLVFNNGSLILEEDTTGAIHAINNITRTDDTFDGGNIILNQGLLVVNNVDYLNSLMIEGDHADTRITLNNVKYIKDLTISDGGLSLIVNHEHNTIHGEDTLAALHVDTATFEGGLTTVVVNTSQLKVNDDNHFLLINADTAINLPSETTRAPNPWWTADITSLSPIWWDTELAYDTTTNQLKLNVTRTATICEIINCDGEPPIVPPTTPPTIPEKEIIVSPGVRDLAKYLDELIAQGVPVEILDYLEYYSRTPTDLYNNLASMIPLSGDNYLKSAHYGLSTALSVSKANALSDDKDVWALYYYSNGRYDSGNATRDMHKANNAQFGYNFWNTTNEGNQHKQSAGVMGGFSVGNMNNYNYYSDILAFNVGSMYKYQISDNILKFSLMYSLSNFDTRRDYFISTNPIPNALSGRYVDQSRLKSSLYTNEILLDAQYSYEFLFKDAFDIMLTPRVFVTPSLLITDSYMERGPYSAMEVKGQTTTITESGAGFDLSKEFHIQGGSLEFALGGDAFYRHYRIPTKKVTFEGTPFGYTIGEPHGHDGFIMTPTVRTSYTYKQSQFGVFYQREQSKDYFENTVGISYKYSF
ncbi:MAG: autotransporter domain-containing protein [Alphaproteobacteria bacterium]|jgi:hypothetical protein|nr:autotransporter domain-containing protein [Alphaproteobacteria bacterium]